MAFSPNFVDLVRNYTTTSGTDDFVLGAAVNGFGSFIDALQVGDSFYYSALGIDNPGDTEVGRGTLLDGGVVSRDPVGGTKTNFKTGTKSVALITAAEWFADTHAMVAGAGATGQALMKSASAADARGILEISGGLNVKWFGAKGDSAPDGSTGSDDTAAIQAAIDQVASLGGGTIIFPEGSYKITSCLTLCKNLRVQGSGRRGSTIVACMAGGGGATTGEGVRNGSALYGGWPSNSSTAANVRVEHMGFVATDPANAGAAFYDNCGTYVSVHDCCFTGFKYGIVLDQTELADIDHCDFELQGAGGAAVYLVNGPTLTPGNLTTVTNRISVTRCQINEYGTAYGILDEGGYTHSFVDNNYNGCLNHIYAAGVQALQVIGGEFETSAGAPVVLDYRRVADGSGVGGCMGNFIGCFITGSSANPCVDIVSSSGPINFAGCLFSRGAGSSAPVHGAGNAYELSFRGCFTDSTNGELADSYNAGFQADDRIEMVVATNSAVASLNLTRTYARKLVRCTNATANACTIQSDATAPLPIGSTFTLEQSAAGPVSLIAASAVTLIGPTATTGQYQRLAARKISANKWVSQLILPNPQAAAQADSSASDIATLTADFNALLAKLRAAGLME